MTDRIFTKKRQRQRNKPFVTTRLILTLVLLSALLAAGFYMEFNDIGDSECTGACENIYSPNTWVLAGSIMLLSIIALAALAGSIIALVKYRARQQDGSAFLDDKPADP